MLNNDHRPRRKLLLLLLRCHLQTCVTEAGHLLLLLLFEHLLPRSRCSSPSCWHCICAAHSLCFLGTCHLGQLVALLGTCHLGRLWSVGSQIF